MAGASLCFRNLKPFMRALLYRYEPPQPSRAKVPPHIKTYCRPNAQGDTPFVVLTSANLSKSAWGKLQLRDTELSINNYELGVLFLPSRLALPDAPPPRLRMAVEASEQPDELCFPLPSRLPLVRYTSEDVAWQQGQPHLQPDSRGFIDTGE